MKKILCLLILIVVVAQPGHTQRPWREKPFIVTKNDPASLERYFNQTYSDMRLGTNDAWVYTDTVADTAYRAYWLADSAMDSANIALAYDLDDICDNGANTDQDVGAEDFFVNQNGPDGDSYVFFWANNNPNGEGLMWDESETRFDFSDDLNVEGDLRVVGDLEVIGKDIDIGDAGGFSGIKFNAGTTEFEFWIDGSKVGSIGTDGVYDNEVP